MDLADTGRRGHRGRGGGVVPGQHGDGVALRAQVGDDARRFGPQLVPHPDHPGGDAVDLEEHSGRPGLLQPGDVGCHRAGVDPARAAEPQGVAGAGAAQAGAGDGMDVLGGRHGRGRGQDGTAEGVLAARLQRRSQAEDLRPVEAGRGDDVDDRRFVGGQRAGLVHREVAHGTQGLQRGTALDQDPVLGGGADGGHHRDRDRDGQRAR